MKKQIGKNLMQKWKNKIRVRLSALDKKKLVLTNIPYILTAFYTNRASFLYRNSLGEDIGNKLLYLFLLSMETLLISITMRILSIIITVILYGRMIEIYLYTSIAPIPFINNFYYE